MREERTVGINSKKQQGWGAGCANLPEVLGLEGAWLLFRLELWTGDGANRTEALRRRSRLGKILCVLSK